MVGGLPASPKAATAVAASPHLEGIIRSMVKLVEPNGKSGCDGNSNSPVRAIKRALADGTLGPEPRVLVLFLAEHKPEPGRPKSEKRGWEAIFYGYMDTA